MSDLTKEDIKEALREAYTEHMEMIGIDISTPAKRIAFMKDMEWLRQSREGISLKEAELDHLFVRAFRRRVTKAAEAIGYSIIVAAFAGVIYLAGFGEKFRIPGN